jgi:hypothetical protein
MNRGAMTWFRMFGATMWNLLIIEPFFHWIFWKTKIENYIGKRCITLHLHASWSGRFLTFNGRESNCQFDFRPFFLS